MKEILNFNVNIPFKKVKQIYFNLILKSFKIAQFNIFTQVLLV